MRQTDGINLDWTEARSGAGELRSFRHFLHLMQAIAMLLLLKPNDAISTRLQTSGVASRCSCKFLTAEIRLLKILSSLLNISKIVDFRPQILYFLTNFLDR